MRHKLCYRSAFYIFIFTIGMVLWFPHFSYAQEEIRLSTFYPAPLGEYDDLSANRMAVGPNYAIPTTDGNLVIEGRVGIGTTSPQANLDVAGDIFKNNAPWIQVGTVDTDDTWVTVTFPTTFASAPIVIGQSQTQNGTDLMTVEVKSVTATGFEIHVNDNTPPHATETIGWIAIQN